jgi:hypothetical protein
MVREALGDETEMVEAITIAGRGERHRPIRQQSGLVVAAAIPTQEMSP